MNWYLIPLGALVLLAAVVLIRAFRFRPKDEERAAPCPVEVDGDRAVRHLAAMVQCRTVSYYDRSRQDMAEFDRFRALLPRLYPAVHRACTFERVGESGLLFTWRGRGSAEPTVLMAHYDVVPVNEAGWSKPAFDGIIEDGVLWGRGTLDTKGTLCGVLEAAETLLEAGFRPENDIYMAFAGDEEISGPSADAIVSLLKERGGELPRVGYVLTRAGSRKYEEIYDQMDRYLPAEHQLAVSLRPGSEGYDFWLGDFVQNVQRLLAE